MNRPHLGEAAQHLDEIAALELLAGRGDELDERLPSVASLAHDEVAEVPGALGLVVCLEPLLARPLAHGVADPVAEVGREPAPADVEHLVPAAGLVEPERRAERRARERVLELVPVVEDLRLAREDLLERRLRDGAEPAERVEHLRLLLLELHLVREVLESAAAAGGVVAAGCLDAVRTRLDDLGRDRLGVVALDLRDAGANGVAGKAAADEDDKAVEARDAVAAVRKRLDLELELLILRDGGGHAARVIERRD